MSTPDDIPQATKTRHIAGWMTTPVPTKNLPRLHRLAVALRPTKWLFAIAALAFLAIAAWDSRDILSGLLVEAVASGIVLAILLGIAVHLFAPVCTATALNVVGGKITYRYALAIHLRNLPARYLPGGVWHTVGRAHDFLVDGMSQAHLAALITLESAMPVGVGLFVSAGLLLLVHDGSEQQLTILMLGFALGGTILAGLPWLIKRVVAHTIAEFRFTQYFKLILIYIFAWLLLAGMFTAYLTSFPDSSAQSRLIETGATYVFSWAVGFIAVFAPQGIGIFEVTAAFFLKNGLGLITIAALIAGFRIIPIFTDIVMWLSYVSYRTIIRTIRN